MGAPTSPRPADLLGPVPATAWSQVGRAVLGTRYPWAPGHLVTGPEDTRVVPHELHPAFHGALDWHSSVHMQWSLVTLLARYPHLLEEAERTAAADLLDARLTAEHLAVETAYLRARPSFERPYGWAWAAQLAAALHEAPGAGSRRRAAAVAPLADLVLDLVVAWLPRQSLPVRHGKHQNDAFALLLLLDAADRLGRDDVADRCRRRARDWFVGDGPAPTEVEPSGTDFLSPALTQATLMTRVLGPEQAGVWVQRFLPGLGAGRHEHLLSVPAVLDPSDGQYAHLLGLALSRAWQLRSLAPLLTDAAAQRLRDGADQQERAVLGQITEGDFMATHWLVSFALLARGAGPAVGER